MTSEIYKKALEIKDYATRIRRLIHQNPEISMKEYNTTALLKKELLDMGVEVVPIAMEVGILGILHGKKDGKPAVTALRADIDALPITEQTGLPYSSQSEGIMHACGHDGHAAVVLGTAKLLSCMRNNFSGTVKFIFQPGEEIFLGAKKMIEAGVLTNPDVDTIVGLHCHVEADAGKIMVWPGPYMASADKFTITVTGKGSHGAKPHKSKDCLLASAHIITALQSIVSRQIDCLENVVISVCTINGGTAFNIIPEQVTLSGTVRCQGESIRRTIERRIKRIVSSTSAAFECKSELLYSYATPPVINHPEVNDMIVQAAVQAIGERSIGKLSGPEMGSEDFSYYLEKISYGALFRLGINRPGEEIAAIHNSRFDFNDEALVSGIATLAQFIINKNQ